MTDHHFSASQLKKWKSCPKKYEYDYVKDVDETKISSGHREMGSSVHEAIEELLQSGVNLDDRDWLERKLKGAEMDLDYEYPEDMKEDVKSCLEMAAKYLSDEQSNVRDVELEVEFTLNHPSLTHDFRGYIDLTTDEGIIDWKTGKAYEWKEKIQAAVYILGYAHEYGEMPEFVEFVYLKEEMKNVHNRIDDEGHVYWDESKNEYLDEIASLGAELKRAWEFDEWEAKPEQSRCYFCDYQLYCPDSGVGVENIPWHLY